MKKEATARETLSLYIRLWKAHGKRNIIYWLCVMLNGGSMFALAATQGVLLSAVTAIASGEQSDGTVSSMAVAAVACVVMVIVSGLLPVAIMAVQEKTGSELRTKFLEARCRTLESECGKISDSDAFVRLTDDLPMALDTVGYYMNGRFLNPIFSGLFSIFLISSVDIYLAAFTLIFSLIVCAPLGEIRKRTVKLLQEIQSSKSGLAKGFGQLLGGISEIKLFGLKDKITGDISKVSERIKRLQTRYEGLNFLRIEWFSLGYFINLAGLVAIGGTLAAHGRTDFSSVMVTLPLSGQVMQMVSGIGGMWAFVRERYVPMSRFFEVLDGKQENFDKKSTSAEDGDIRFENVSFSYTGETLALKNVSFEVKKGQSAAFVGQSGSGKSTILRLLTGLYTPQQGKIAMGGTPIDDVSLPSWRKNFAWVMQDSRLFNVSLEENIAFASKADGKEVRNAAVLAAADGFISETAEGYGRKAGQDGSSLSGGQRQRIAIARAIAAHSPVMLFDEITSALDGKTEEYIKQTVDTIKKDKTVIMVSHKLAVSRICDTIYYMKGGEITERGSHDELMALKGDYYALWNSQQSDKN